MLAGLGRVRSWRVFSVTYDGSELRGVEVDCRTDRSRGREIAEVGGGVARERESSGEGVLKGEGSNEN